MLDAAKKFELPWSRDSTGFGQASFQPNTYSSRTGIAAPAVLGAKRNVGSRRSRDDLACRLPLGSLETFWLA